MGTWEDIKQFSDKYELMLEYMVNHISPSSDEFQDFLKKGDECETADMWIDWKKFWPKGEGTLLSDVGKAQPRVSLLDFCSRRRLPFSRTLLSDCLFGGREGAPIPLPCVLFCLVCGAKHSAVKPTACFCCTVCSIQSECL